MTIKHLYPNARPSLDLKFAKDKVLDPRITYSRASSGTYYDTTGLLKSAATNEARFDHDPTTGESLGLLVEESRTNSIIRSATLGGFDIRGNSFVQGQVAPDGSATAITYTQDSQSGIKYTLTSTSGNQTFSVYAKAGTQTTLILLIWDGSYGGTAFDLSNGTVSPATSGWTAHQPVDVGNGWYRCVLTRNVINTTSPEFWIQCNTDNTSLILWGAQVEAGSFPTSYIPTPATFTSRASTATYYDANGTIQTAATNVARDNAYLPDENGVMRPAGLLLEAAGTNLEINSEDLSSYLNVGVTWTTNNVVAPDGQTTADTPSTDNFPLILGVYVNGGFIGVNASEVTDSWKRFSITFTPSGSQSINTYPLLNAGSNIYTRGVTPTISTTHTYSGYFKKVGTTIIPWGLQLEASPYPTSYIPTSGSTVTRAADVSSSSTVTRSADVAQITGSNFSSWYNQSEGTFYASLRDGKKSGRVLEVNDNTDNNRHGLVWTATNSQFFTTTAGSTFFNSSVTTATNPRNSTLAYKSGSYAGTAAGLTPTTNSGTTVPSVTQIWIGGPVGNGSALNNYPNGHISRLTYYPVRLPDATLQILTS